ncbi:MAG: hypothetical protein JF597_03195 [Streptomyces sp.]|uniref:hypothetical protein n=1 Tax=Streptomyces sp. TaxID=1931 RepID=UPI0025EAFC22|nr:hypothetical protein [Streptomyces sp.]MBW8792618.1 hypothetical protein [Streptomyces sp.]
MNTRQLENPMSPMALLAHGIPLSLLLDLAWGPMSADLLSHESPRRTPNDYDRSSAS